MSDTSLFIETFSTLTFRLIYNANDHPSRRTAVIPDGLARGQPVRRNDHSLVHTGPLGVYGDLRDALRLAGVVNRLAHHEATPFEARMLPGRNHIAFHTREQHD
jgi:hypothetical protein